MEKEIAMILLPALATFILRAIPFILIGKKDMSPKVKYIGSVLPAAIMATLIIYCIKNVTIQNPIENTQLLISIVVVAALHIWKKKTLVSIIAGTAVYMILLNYR